MAVVSVFPTAFGRDHRPRVVVGNGGWLRGLVLRACPTTHLCLQCAQLLLDVADDLGHIHCWGCRIDYVAVHVLLAISRYPRGAAPSRLPSFRRAPCMPSGAKVLRARPAVIAGRAYGLIEHGFGLPVGCLRRCPGSVPPGWRLCLLLSHPGRTAPRAVWAPRPWVLRLPQALSFFPIVTCRFRLGQLIFSRS